MRAFFLAFGAVFAELKVNQLVKRRNIKNWPGMLIAAVAPYFDPPATELKQYRARTILSVYFCLFRLPWPIRREH